MDFGFTEEQQEVQGLAHRILEDKVTEELLREVEARGDARFDRDTWTALADAGLLGIGLPEKLGGGGFGLIEQYLLLEEIGQTVAPVPVLASIVMGAMTIAAFGTDDQQERWVRPAAAGTKILTAALSEPLNRDHLRPTTTARLDGTGWRLDGIKTCVPAATLADVILVPATSVDDGSVGVFLVDPAQSQVTITGQHTSNRDLEGYVEFDGAHVDADGRLPDPSDGSSLVEWMMERATLGLCAVQFGVTERALAATAKYAINRVQFERPIATFQAVGHRCADAYIDVEAIGLTLWQAAWRLSAGLPAGAEVAVAKYWAASGGHRVAHAAVHIHGGMGVATEYSIHRYFIAAKQIEFTLGGAKEQLLRLGARLAVEPV
jgi:alkylation response protein AidB-like acyl-CoA dehydrogenase